MWLSHGTSVFAASSSSRYNFTPVGSVDRLTVSPITSGSYRVFTHSFSLGFTSAPVPGSSGTVVVVPEGYDFAVVYVGARISAASNCSVNSIQLTGNGFTSYPSHYEGNGAITGTSDYYLTASSDVAPGQPIVVTSFTVNTEINATNTSSNAIVSCTSLSGYIQFFSLSGSDGVTRQDILDQTNDLTNGFDSSGGDQAADQLGQEVDNYLKTEDALYDQMQYDVPEIDLQADAQGILLASNFLQSLYVSDSFISKVITYVLSFGLILFIVGWLKKRDSG